MFSPSGCVFGTIVAASGSKEDGFSLGPLSISSPCFSIVGVSEDERVFSPISPPSGRELDKFRKIDSSSSDDNVPSSGLAKNSEAGLSIEPSLFLSTILLGPSVGIDVGLSGLVKNSEAGLSIPSY